MRSKPLHRKTRLAPTPVNTARRKSAFVRCYHSDERTEFVQSLPCIVCRSFPCDNMHIKGDGVGRKANYDQIVPCCRTHHEDAHRIGIKTFAKAYGLDLPALAAQTEALWREYQAIAVLHTTDPLCARCKASFREEGSAFCGSCQELNRHERPAKAQKPPRDAA